jgi:oligoendopeptidase F
MIKDTLFFSFENSVSTSMKLGKEIVMSTTTVTPVELTRDQVPEHLTWNLSSIYANNQEWEREFAEVAASIPSLARFDGKIKTSAETLAEALLARDQVLGLVDKLYVYASMRSDQDTANDLYKGMFARIRSLSIKASETSSYIHPQLLKIAKSKLKSWIAANDTLKLYKVEIDDLFRQKKHYLPAAQESLLAQAEELFDAGGTAYSSLTESDFEYPSFTDDQGNTHQLTGSNFTVLLDHPNRSVRRGAFEGVMGLYGKFNNTFSATYAANVKANIFKKNARGYASCREMAMFDINVPVSVYDSLIETVHSNLPKLHRYIALRRKTLGLPDLHFYDLYCPLVPDVDFKMSFNDACELILKAVAPLGPEYVATLRKGLFELRWADVLPNKNKADGAYSGGSYLTDPFMLLNWHETLDAIYTLIHEAGHSMHSWFTRRNQPKPTGQYTLFVAEVASICNEGLLTAHLLKTVTDVNVRKYVLTQAMEGFRGTLYRQALFAEFEMLAYAAAERGEPLTPALLNEIHLGLNQKYYGAEVVIDDQLKYEWSRIPHFYRSFYVYQYSTGISAASALSRQILEEGQPAVDRYLGFLKSGSSKDSLQLLRDAGVDLSTSAPIQQALDLFESYIEEYEKLS